MTDPLNSVSEMQTPLMSNEASPSDYRRINLKIFLSILGGMLLALIAIRLFAMAMGASGEAFIGRPLGALSYLPQIVQEPTDQVMVFGSSMVDAGFSPRQFDRELKEQGVDIKSYNFGFGGLNPYFQDLLARRIKEHYLQNNKRLKLAVIEFNPFQTTQTRYQGSLAAIDAYFGMLSNEQERFDLLLEDPTRGILVYDIKYLRDSVSAEMVTFYFGQAFRSGRPKPNMEPETEAEVARRRDVNDKLEGRFEQDFPDYVNEPWSFAWQGGGTIPQERSDETVELIHEYFASLRTEYRMQADKLWRAQSADIIELNFEPILVESFIRMVKEFQQFSDAVEIIMLPKNSRYIVNSPEALARQQNVLKQIYQATGVTVRDFQNIPEITPDMYSDTTHLARYSGDVAFTHFLAEYYGELLKK